MREILLQKAAELSGISIDTILYGVMSDEEFLRLVKAGEILSESPEYKIFLEQEKALSFSKGLKID